MTCLTTSTAAARITIAMTTAMAIGTIDEMSDFGFVDEDGAVGLLVGPVVPVAWGEATGAAP